MGWRRPLLPSSQASVTMLGSPSPPSPTSEASITMSGRDLRGDWGVGGGGVEGAVGEVGEVGARGVEVPRITEAAFGRFPKSSLEGRVTSFFIFFTSSSSFASSLTL